MRWSSAAEQGELDRAVALINSIQQRTGVPQDDLDAQFDFPSTRFAAYGTLMPGQSNHALLANVAGVWVDGTVQGERFMANGYPAFKWRPNHEQVPVSVLTSAALPEHWARLDDFEGVDYRRILVPVRLTNNGTNLVAYLYEYIRT
jgi:gamma-glutamylcyclotransferase (GGCT)/AIG2-like uncharacterized protein YtfP